MLGVLELDVESFCFLFRVGENLFGHVFWHRKERKAGNDCVGCFAHEFCAFALDGEPLVAECGELVRKGFVELVRGEYCVRTHTFQNFFGHDSGAGSEFNNCFCACPMNGFQHCLDQCR